MVYSRPDKAHQQLGLPPRVFLYTLDQIATMLEVKEPQLKKICFFNGREPGFCPKDRLSTVNIMPEGEKPEWRVSEANLIKYLRVKGIKFYMRGYGS